MSKNMSTWKDLIHNRHVTGYIFIAPWLIGFFAFKIIPMMASFFFSFTRYDIVSPPVWIGFANYVRMFFGDERYLKAVTVTLFYVFVSVPLKVIFALLVAVLLDWQSRAAGLYRALFYLPSLVGGSVAIALLWKELFTKNGAVNSLLRAVGITANISWIGHPTTAIWVLILLGIWQFGSAMLIFAAGLKQIPETYYEAAKIDGASAPQRFLHITLPILTPIIFFNFVMQLINGFMVFTQAYIITTGGPLDTTLFYALYIYQRAFQWFDMGYGCAMAWVLLIIISVVTALVFKSSSYWVYYETKESV